MAVERHHGFAAAEAHSLGVLLGHKEHRVEHDGGIGAEVHVAQRLALGVGDELVEAFVLLGGHVLLALHPDSLHGVQVLTVEIDGEAHEVTVLGEDVAGVVALGEVLGVFLQENLDARATGSISGGIGEGVALLAIAFPLHGGGIGLPGAGGHLHLVGSHEHAVEAHAKLADEILRAALALLHGLQELLGAGVSNRAQELHYFILGHADTAIGDGEGAGFLIGGNSDAELALGLVDISLRQLLESQLLQRVRGVGNQLAHKHLAVAVKGVNHNVQQLPDLRLELMRICHSFGWSEVCPLFYCPQKKGQAGIVASLRSARHERISSRSDIVQSRRLWISSCPARAGFRFNERTAFT